MAEAFVRTIKRDYVRVSPAPDAKSVLHQLPSWLAHYNEVHPHKALGYRSRASSSPPVQPRDPVRSFGGNNTRMEPSPSGRMVMGSTIPCAALDRARSLNRMGVIEGLEQGSGQRSRGPIAAAPAVVFL